MVLDLWGRLRPFWESGESHGLSFMRSAKFTSPLLGPERSISVLHFAPNEGRKLMVTSNSAPGIKHSIYSVNLLGKTGLSTNSKPEALGLWVSLQAALVKAIDPELSAPIFHMVDTYCLSVLSSNVTFSERITFLTPYFPQALFVTSCSCIFTKIFISTQKMFH